LYFIGDLHHLTSDDAHAELGKIISDEKLCRRSAEKVTVFDGKGADIPVVGARLALTSSGANVATDLAWE
jgi:ornithine cyclodeaminase/alanine dehydrogenase-like protein (mu-crystallin family)